MLLDGEAAFKSVQCSKVIRQKHDLLRQLLIFSFQFSYFLFFFIFQLWPHASPIPLGVFLCDCEPFFTCKVVSASRAAFPHTVLI